MCFSNKVQVKLNLLENFAFKNLRKKEKKLVLAKRFSMFFDKVL